MKKLTIYEGRAVPMVVRGKNQCRLLAFAYKYKCWHTFNQDKRTVTAVKVLYKKGYIEVIGDQFKIK